MEKNKIIFTNKLINTLANSPYEINQQFLKLKEHLREYESHNETNA